MTRASRDKGNRNERTIVHLFQEHGIGAERIPLSGAAGGSFAGDVTIPIVGVDRVFEAKVRGTGFSRLYTWLADHYGLFVKADRKAMLVVLRAEDFAELVVAAERGKV